ncbi:SGNH/GDSL hydrolase family protein [uncultured Croceitalea sp.]|uniref:SGNH/GDSL hydrolase family protein n=1 Tax=uncultured Croceitalea sp. TaxID=1798908 RepID=UPI0033056140
MNLKYLSGAIISLPLLPIMYYQGKRIRASVPQLPQAKGVEGEYVYNRNTNTGLNIISIGESTIAGVGVQTHEEGFTGTFAKEISQLFNSNIKWKVYARSGYTARKVEKKIIPKIIEKQVDLIVIGLGGNDAFTLNRPSKWKVEIRSLIVSIRLKFPKAIIVFCNMPPIKEFPAFTPLIKFTVGNLVEVLGEELQKIVDQFQDVFYFGGKITLNGWIDKFQLSEKKDAFFSDGVHPSKLTYQIWGKDIANEVFKNEKIKNALQKNI